MRLTFTVDGANYVLIARDRTWRGGIAGKRDHPDYDTLDDAIRGIYNQVLIKSDPSNATELAAKAAAIKTELTNIFGADLMPTL